MALRSRLTWGHGVGGASLVLNEQWAADGTEDAAKWQDTAVVDELIRDPTFRDLRDPLHLAQGGALGRVHKGMGFWRLRGRILVPDATQLAKLGDRERDFRAAFDPYQCALDSPTTDGAYALAWDELQTADATFTTGRRPVQIYARPTAHPQMVERYDDGPVRDFAIGLVAPDPRVYRQVESTLALTPASPTGNVINLGNTPAPLKATIVMAGAGSATFTITRAGLAFVLNLSGMVNLDTVVVLFDSFSGPYGRGKLITKNGVENFGLKVSAVDTWLTAPIGTTGFTISNTTNVTSCTLAWRSCWA